MAPGAEGMDADFDRALSLAVQYYALTFHRQGDVARAKEEYLDALKLDPDNHSALADLGQMMMTTSPGDETARLLVELADLAIEKKSEAYRQVSLQFVYHAVRLKQHGNFEEAEIWYRRAIQTDPASAVPHFNLGVLYEARSEISKAKDAYRTAMELDKDYVQPYIQLALILENEGRLLEAVDLLQEARERDVADAFAFANLGNCHLKLGDRKAAMRSYEAALQSAPAHADALNGIGLLILEDAETASDASAVSEAVDLFRRAFEADPTFEGFRLNYRRALALQATLNSSSGY